MKKVLIIIAMMFGMSSVVFSQGMGEIRGKVTDSSTHETMPGVKLVIKVGSSTIWAETDINGNFVIKPLSGGSYDVEVSFTGYRKCVLEQVKVSPDQITKVEDVELSSRNILKPAIINAYRDPLIPLTPVTTIRADQFEDIAGKTDIPSMIQLITPGVTKNENGDLFFRGSRSNDFAYYIDGVKSATTNMNVPSVAIGSIQVYTGGVPARYGDFTGGCIVVETQSYFDWLNAQKR